MELNPWAIGGIVVIGVVTFYLGFHSSRRANTTADFLLARRIVRSRRNAAAITGEYISAASFLGIAGLVFSNGVDSLWYGVGFTAGFLALLLFVAAPLRRSGAYTVPDFAEARLGSSSLRTLCTVFVVLIGIAYLLPQLQAAGLTLQTIMPVPGWVGEVVVVALVTINVFGGGMRSITVVQAFQYWVKLFALLVPTFVLIAVFLTNHAAQPSISGDVAPVLAQDRTVTVETPVVLQAHDAVRFTAHGTIDHQPAKGIVFWSPGQNHDVDKGTTLSFGKGSAVPNVVGAPPTNTLWLRPQDGGLSTLLTTYSLILALFLGTMGLPHVLVRFYTNPNGKAARRTTLHVLLLLGLFYLFPTALGVLSRLYVPQLLVTGQTDAAILLLPTTVLPGPVGEILAAIIVAGAFAAFLSVSSGLIVSIAGVLSTEALPGRVRDFRVATVIAAAVPTGLAIALPPTEVSLSVGMSFALAASTFCPVLLAGVWWPKLTWVGAAAGIVVGGGLVITALVLNVVSEYTGGWAPWLVVQPALVTVPAAFATVYLVSKATQNRRPPDVSRLLLRMHAPDPLGFIQDRDIDRFGATDEQERIVDGRHHRR
ncbi:MAG TPA: cation acetate symporter [Pseudonocardiaceae bacterium]|nr:cation acetate symporter [Pseudonocardiaceae bacterium]